MSILSTWNIPVHMDYVGQKHAELIARIIITSFGIVGFIWGYVTQVLSQTIYTLAVGFVIAALITLPPWPIYRKHPLNWQKVKSDSKKKN